MESSVDFCLGKHLSHRLQYPQTLVSDNELDALKAASAKPLEEVDPACLVLFHPLSRTQNLTITVLIYSNRHQNSHIFIFSTPVSLEVDSVNVIRYNK